MDNQTLVLRAKNAAENAYIPYSGFGVGAALLTEEGKLFTGCNIENMSYGATMCAERTAIYKAVSEGYRNFTKIAVVAKSGELAYPCGMCLQVLQEFAPEIVVVLWDKEQGIQEMQLKELLPFGFSFSVNR